MIENSPTPKNRVYFKNLDALRFLAAFGVIIFHFFREINGAFPELGSSKIFKTVLAVTDKGRLGVNFFFVLSGFLITYLILAEIQTKGKFEFPKFMARRFLRIWPLYFIIGIFGFVIFPIIIEGFSTSHVALNYFFFLANFDEIYHGGQDAVNFLTSPWSVAIEEQFYLFWGLAFFLPFKFFKHFLPYFIVLLYLLSFLFRWENYLDEKILYYHTISVFQDILTGSILAWFMSRNAKWIDQLSHLSRPFVVAIYTLGILVCLLKNNLFFGQLIVFERFILSMFFGYVILDQINGNHSIYKIGSIRPFTNLGKISYGLYMYHLVVFYLLNLYLNTIELSIFSYSIIYFGLGIGGTVLISALSYRLIEKPLLKLKPH